MFAAFVNKNNPVRRVSTHTCANELRGIMDIIMKWEN